MFKITFEQFSALVLITLPTILGEKKTASTWPPLQVALRSETDVFTLLPATSTSETACILPGRTDSSAESDEETKAANERRPTILAL